jgi:hypothetical protein
MSYAKQVSKRNTAANREIELGEEEIADVSLATFYVFDTETPPRAAKDWSREAAAAVAAKAAAAESTRAPALLIRHARA